MIFSNHAKATFADLRSALARFLAAAPGAIQAHLNVAEIQRISLMAFATGGASAVLPALLTLANLSRIVAPQDAALATALVTIVVEVRRRLGHGQPVGTL